MAANVETDGTGDEQDADVRPDDVEDLRIESPALGVGAQGPILPGTHIADTR